MIASQGNKYQDNFLEQVVAREEAKEEQRNCQLKKYIQKRESSLIDRHHKDTIIKEERRSDFLKVVAAQ